MNVFDEIKESLLMLPINQRGVRVENTYHDEPAGSVCRHHGYTTDHKVIIFKANCVVDASPSLRSGINSACRNGEWSGVVMQYGVYRQCRVVQSDEMQRLAVGVFTDTDDYFACILVD